MIVKSGLEIVRLHEEYQEKIAELEEAIQKLSGHGYTQSVLDVELKNVRTALLTLEETRYQALDRVVIGPSMLGATQKYGNGVM